MLTSRFWRKVNQSAGDLGCWLWIGARAGKGYYSGGGYGVLRRNKQLFYAHRFMWEAVHGPIFAGLFVLHHCDVPNCVNPKHLWLGTCADNSADMKSKGRSTAGERDGMAKLTEVEVRQIRASAETHQELANMYGIRRESIGKIKRRERWAHVI